MSIRRVRIIHREIDTWIKGSTYEAPMDAPFAEDQIMFERSYPRDASTEKIWNDIRAEMIVAFFGIFYPIAVEATIEPEFPTRNPDIALDAQTRHIKQGGKSGDMSLYEWDERLGKWHITEEGYIKRVLNIDRSPRIEDLMEQMDISVASSAFDEMFDSSMLDLMQREFAGQTKSIVLFVYPDRYDQEIRAMFELELVFWD